MGPVSRWAVNRPWQAIIAWIVLLVVVGFGVLTHAGEYNDSFTCRTPNRRRPAVAHGELRAEDQRFDRAGLVHLR